jgi:putative hemolysin
MVFRFARPLRHPYRGLRARRKHFVRTFVRTADRMTHPIARSRRWTKRLRVPAIVPTLCAYGGLRLRDRGAPFHADVLGRLGTLEVRLARTAVDVRRAQRLRFDVFYKEMSAVPDAAARLARRDIDPYDAVCDHLLVIDHAAESMPWSHFLRRTGDHFAGKCSDLRGRPSVVGTYRLLRQDVAERRGGFYSSAEFEVAALVARHRDARFLELGRSCVLPPYRNRRTVELLWHGIWSYVLAHRLDVMIGCASLEGTDPDRLALPLSFLHHFARAPDAWRVSALPQRHVEMNRLPASAIDRKAALHALPPLIKGYLRLGGTIGDGAVIDHQFGTTDVFIVLPVAAISTRYIGHFGEAAQRHTA